ncbi:MAG: carbohydrate ABC transporter permease, partial [Lachnospiraceae bacterium]|nr:carbohydrate ABC transporter permease [Lachnospiraceae bacterium]
MKKTISNVLIYIVLILVSIIMLVPFAWMFLTAFKTTAETMQVDPFVIVPSVWQTQNFANVIQAMDFVRLYANTLAMVALRILFAVLTSTLAGYAFARLHFKGKNFMFTLVLVQMMIPVQIYVIPQYVMVSKMHLTNTVMGLVFPGLVSAFGTFLLRQAYMQ